MLGEIDEGKIFQAFLGGSQTSDLEQFGIDRQNPSSVDRVFGIRGLWEGVKNTHHHAEWRLVVTSRELLSGEVERSLGFDLRAGDDDTDVRVRYFPEIWGDRRKSFHPSQGGSLYVDKNGEEVAFNAPVAFNACRMGTGGLITFMGKEDNKQLVIDPRNGRLAYDNKPAMDAK